MKIETMQDHGALAQSIIIDPDLETRMRLKQAVTSVPRFGKSVQCASVREAASHLDSSSEHYDVVFVSHHFHDDVEMDAFIQRAKSTGTTQDAAFIKVLPAPADGGSSVASQIARGFDGFLVEPYSVNSLTEIIELAGRVKKERGESRAKVAVGILTSDMMDQLDLVAHLKSSGYDVGKSWTRFKDMANSLRDFSVNYFEVCLNTIVNLFSEAPLPKKVFQIKRYGGVSQRVKKKMEEKMLAEMEKKKTETRIIKKNN